MPEGKWSSPARRRRSRGARPPTPAGSSNPTWDADEKRVGGKGVGKGLLLPFPLSATLFQHPTNAQGGQSPFDKYAETANGDCPHYGYRSTPSSIQIVPEDSVIGANSRFDEMAISMRARSRGRVGPVARNDVTR